MGNDGCYGYGDDPLSVCQRERELLENFLCELLTTIEQRGYWLEFIHEGAPISTWWMMAHNEKDRRRASIEAVREQDKALRREALAKLTDAEREVLGIRKER